MKLPNRVNALPSDSNGTGLAGLSKNPQTTRSFEALADLLANGKIPDGPRTYEAGPEDLPLKRSRSGSMPLEKASPIVAISPFNSFIQTNNAYTQLTPYSHGNAGVQYPFYPGMAQNMARLPSDKLQKLPVDPRMADKLARVQHHVKQHHMSPAWPSPPLTVPRESPPSSLISGEGSPKEPYQGPDLGDSKLSLNSILEAVVSILFLASA